MSTAADNAADHVAMAAAISAMQRDLHAMRDLAHRTSLGHDQRLLRAEKVSHEESQRIRDELKIIVDLVTDFVEGDRDARIVRQSAFDHTLREIRWIAIGALALSALNVVLWLVQSRLF